jgi:hypothetical protein
VAALVVSGRIDRSFAYDESVTVGLLISRGSASAPLFETQVFNNHPLFAVAQSIWWAVGGEGEARQRVLPILYGALAVGLLSWWVARRFGTLAGLSSAGVLMMTPMFVEQARQVRGYSLVALAVTVATIALVDYVRTDRTLLLVVHAVAALVAVGTHAFAAVPLVAIGVAALIVRGFDRRMMIAWLLAAFGAFLLYLPTLDELRETADARGSRYSPGFGRFLLWELFGRDRLTAVVVLTLSLVGIATLSRRRIVVAAAAVAALVVVVEVLLIWQVWQPLDLFARFFLALVPLIAIAVGSAVRRVPPAAGLVLVALLFTSGNVVESRRTEVPLREVAVLVRSAVDRGDEVCVIGSESLVAYVAPPTEFVVDPARLDAQFEACDMLIRIGSWGAPVRTPASEVYPYSWKIGGFDVYSRRAAGEFSPDAPR